MEQTISDYSKNHVEAVQDLVDARFGRQISLHLGDSEVQLDPKEENLTICPLIIWNARECNFMVMKTGEDQYQARYFYNDETQYNTKQAQFTDLTDCVTAVMREQADDERQAEMAKDGVNGADGQVGK